MDQGFVNLIELGGKARSKAELYRLLTAEGHLYLPPYKICPVDFIADVIDGKKSVWFNSFRKAKLLVLGTRVQGCHYP